MLALLVDCLIDWVDSTRYFFFTFFSVVALMIMRNSYCSPPTPLAALFLFSPASINAAGRVISLCALYYIASGSWGSIPG